jgi:uncharacterized membrane protein
MSKVKAKVKEDKEKPKREKQPRINEKELPTVRGALGRIGKTKTTPATLIIVASTITRHSPDEVWKVWAELEKWPAWSQPLHASTRWIEKRDWEVGAKFQQVLNWGFPFGKSTSTDTVMEVNPGQSVSWWKNVKGVESCHIWFFEPLPDGGTRIVKTEVFIGLSIFLGRLFVKRRWKAMFQSAVDGLARAVDRQTQAAGTPSTAISS